MPDVLRNSEDTQNPKLARPVGIQTTRGLVHYYTKKGNQTYFILLLGRGEENGEGWLDGIVWFRYGGRLLTPYDPTTGQGDYIFHPGRYSTGFNDPVQGKPTFFPEFNYTWSGIAYCEVRLPAELSEGTDEPTRSEVKLRGAVMFDYDVNGVASGPTFTVNPARLAAWVARLGKVKVATRFDWSSWVTEFRNRCDVGLGWAAGGGDGLTGEYFLGSNSFTNLLTTRIDPQIEFNWGNANPITGIVDAFSVRWTGKLDIQTAENYTFYLEADDAARLFINNALVIDNLPDDFPEQQATVNLPVGKHDIRVEYYDVFGAARVFLMYESPSVSKRFVPKDRLFSSAAAANNGRTVPRFEGDTVFAGIDFPSAFAAVMKRAPAVEWQDVNGKIRFLWGPERQSVHTFIYDPGQTAIASNIVKKSVSAQRKDPFSKINFFQVGFFDKDDDLLTKKYIPVDRPLLREALGGHLVDGGVMEMGVCTQSQAERSGECAMRQNTDLDTEVQLKGQKKAHHVAKGDRVTLIHPLGDWTGTTLEGHQGPLDCIVNVESFDSSMTTANEKTFILHEYHPEYYSDTSHGPIIRRATGDVPSPFAAPPTVQTVLLTQGSRLLTDGTFLPTIQGLVTFNPAPYAQRGRVWWKKPGASTYTPTEHTLIPNPTTLQAGFELVGVAAGFNQIVVVTETLSGIALPFAGHPVWPITTTGNTNAPTAPGTPSATLGNNGNVVWTWTASPENDVSFYQMLDAAETIVPGGAHLDSLQFIEAPTAAVLQRRVRAVNRSGNPGPASGIGTFTLPTPTTPTATISYDGQRVVITVTNPIEGVGYDYATANDGTGILAQNHGPRFEVLNPNTNSRSITYFVRSVRFGAASAWVAVSTTINAPAAPTLAVDAVFPFHGVVLINPPVGLNTQLIRRTIVETSTVSNFATVASTFIFDGVAGAVEISGRFASTPTLFVRARYEDGFGPGSNSAVVSITFQGLLGSDIAAGSLDFTAFAASLSVPRIVTSLPTLPNSQFPVATIVLLNNAAHPDNGKLFRNVNGAWTKAVDGGDIVAASILAGSIAAGAIGATQLAAGSVRANHLLIGNFDNLVQDPGFELNGIGWTLGVGMNIAGPSPGVNTHGGVKFVSAVTTGQYLMNDVFADCTAGDIFTLDVWIKHTGGNGGTPIIRWYDQNKAQISESTGVSTGIVDATLYTKWNVTDAAPTGAVYARPGFLTTGPLGWWIDDFYFRRVIGSTVIQDGAILTRHLTAESISARHLVVAALSDNLLSNSGFEVHTGGVLDAWLQVGATVQTFGSGQGSFLQVPNLAAAASKMIAVTPGETVAIKYRAWRPATGVTLTVKTNWKASRNPSLPPYIYDASNHAPDQFTTIFNGDITTTATDYEFTVVVPAGMFWMSLVFTGTNVSNFDDVQVKRQIGNAFIANLSVDSAKLANATITMAKVASLISSDYVQDTAGFRLMPGGTGEFNGGILVKSVPLTEIQIRAINSIDQNGRWRGNDTGRVPVSVIQNPAVDKGLILDDNTADVVITAQITGYGIDDTANADSANRAHVDVLNKFGELVKSFPDIGYFGQGVAGFGAYNRKYADPVEEAIFKILIRNRGGYSDPVYLTGVTRSTTLPATKLRANCPLELSASPVSATSISLAWQFGSSVTVFRRQRGTSTWISHQTGVSSATPFLVTGLSELTWYEFKVSAGSGNDSNIVLMQTKQIGSTAPAFPAPSGLSGSPDGTNPTTQINLTWARNATDNDGVEVYKDGALLTTLSAGATSYSATGLTANTAYTFKVRNKWNTGPTFSEFSNEVTVKTQAAGAPSGSAPSGLSVFNSSVEFDYEATLNWINNGAGGTISVERKLGAGGTWSVIQSGLASSTTSYVDTTVTPGTNGSTYFYRVVNSALPTQYSNEDFVFIEPYAGGDPFCVTLDTPILIVDSGERSWLPIGEIEVGMIVVTVNTLTGLTNKAYVRELNDGFADVLFTCHAATGEAVRSSDTHPYCRLGDRYGTAVSKLNGGAPLLRLPDIEARQTEQTTVDHVSVEELAEPVPVRTLGLSRMNHTFITAGLVSHNVKPFL